MFVHRQVVSIKPPKHLHSKVFSKLLIQLLFCLLNKFLQYKIQLCKNSTFNKSLVSKVASKGSIPGSNSPVAGYCFYCPFFHVALKWWLLCGLNYAYSTCCINIPYQCKLPVLQIIRPSANMCMNKRSGHTEPCGTPDVTSACAEKSPLKFTNLCQSDKIYAREELLP